MKLLEKVMEKVDEIIESIDTQEAKQAEAYAKACGQGYFAPIKEKGRQAGTYNKFDTSMKRGFALEDSSKRGEEQKKSPNGSWERIKKLLDAKMPAIDRTQIVDDAFEDLPHESSAARNKYKELEGSYEFKDERTAEQIEAAFEQGIKNIYDGVNSKPQPDDQPAVDLLTQEHMNRRSKSAEEKKLSITVYLSRSGKELEIYKGDSRVMTCTDVPFCYNFISAIMMGNSRYDLIMFGKIREAMEHHVKGVNMLTVTAINSNIRASEAKKSNDA